MVRLSGGDEVVYRSEEHGRRQLPYGGGGGGGGKGCWECGVGRWWWGCCLEQFSTDTGTIKEGKGLVGMECGSGG